MDEHLSPSYRFDAANDPRKVAEDLLAFRTYNKLDNRHIIEVAHNIVIDDRDSSIANRFFAGALGNSDSAEAPVVRKGVAVA